MFLLFRMLEPRACWCMQVMKNEPLKITYSYWDGQGHRRTLTVRKGDTVLQFLGKVKEQLLPDFRDMRWAPSHTLLHRHAH